MAILGVIFFPQTAVQFFGEQQKNSIKASLWCDTPVIDADIDYSKELNTIEMKLDSIIETINDTEASKIVEEKAVEKVVEKIEKVEEIEKTDTKEPENEWTRTEKNIEKEQEETNTVVAEEE